jgi:hypothetical protein
MICGFAALLCLFGLVQTPCAFAWQSGNMTQHRINEWAAALENARIALIEGTGLRHAGESLPSYLDRIAVPLPGESPAVYRARIARYLAALTQVTTATASARRLPRLSDADPANRQRWIRATQALSYLPTHLERLCVAWQARTQADSPAAHLFPAELHECLNLIIAALAELRDAYP